MSGFLDYFKSLGMPYIRKARGTNEGMVHVVAGLMDDAKEDMKWLRRQFFPQLCDKKYVEGHAAARGLTRYEYESDALFRARVSNAYLFFAAGGRKHGVDEFFQELGLDIHVLEYHEYDREPEIGWAEFIGVVDMASLYQTTVNREFVASILNELKPARSKMAYILWINRMVQFVIEPMMDLDVTTFVSLRRCDGIAVRSYDVIGWGCRTLNNTWTLDNGWGTLEIDITSE